MSNKLDQVREVSTKMKPGDTTTKTSAAHCPVPGENLSKKNSILKAPSGALDVQTLSEYLASGSSEPAMVSVPGSTKPIQILRGAPVGGISSRAKKNNVIGLRPVSERYEWPQCRCQKRSKRIIIRKPSSVNKGKYFFGCCDDIGSFNRCKFWMLEDDWKKRPESGFSSMSVSR